MSHKDQVYHYMDTKGPIDPITALNEIGSMRLGARIKELRNSGVDIADEWEETINSKGEKKRYKKYWLVR